MANDSFSQMSPQSARVTESPNHWCASSWDRTNPEAWQFVRSALLNVDRPWVSIARPGKLSVTAMP